MAALSYIVFVLFHAFVKGPFFLTTNLPENHTEGMDVPTAEYFNSMDTNTNKSTVSETNEVGFPKLKNESSYGFEYNLENQTDGSGASTDPIPNSENVKRIESISNSSENPGDTENGHINLTPTIPENSCKDQGTCEANKAVDIPICYCDDACQIFRDCCFDGPQTPVDDYSEALQHFEKKTSFAKCETVQFGVDAKFRLAGSYIISTCPTDFPLVEVTQKCQFGDMFPVNTLDGLTYKNVYCAYCHDITEYDVWEFEFFYDTRCTFESLAALEFTGSIAKMNHVMSTGCRYHFRPRVKQNVRYCWLYEKVELKDGTNQNMCEKFVNPVYTLGKEKLRKNVHCLADKTPYWCVSPSSSGIRSGFSEVGLSGIFNLRPAIKVADQRICNVNEIYSQDSDSCILKQCTDSEDTMCEPELVKNFLWETDKFNFVTDGLTDKDIFVRVLVFCYLSLPREKYELVFRYVFGSFACGKTNTFSRPCCVFEGTAYFSLQKELTPESIENFKTQAQSFSWSYTEMRPNVTVTVKQSDQQHNTTDDICNVGAILFSGFASSDEFELNMQLFVFDDSKRSKSEMPEFFKGIGVTKRVHGRKESTVHLQDWVLHYKSSKHVTSSGVAHASEQSAVTLICWITGAIIVFCRYVVSN